MRFTTPIVALQLSEVKKNYSLPLTSPPKIRVSITMACIVLHNLCNPKTSF